MSGVFTECGDVDKVNGILNKAKCCNNCTYKVRLYDEKSQEFVWNATVTSDEQLHKLIQVFNDVYIQKQD